MWKKRQGVPACAPFGVHSRKDHKGKFVFFRKSTAEDGRKRLQKVVGTETSTVADCEQALTADEHDLAHNEHEAGKGGCRR